MEYEFSDIDGTMLHKLPENQDLFTLFEFSAKMILHLLFYVKTITE